MKICIVTVYDSINSGSYWQAFALGQVLRSMGHEVCYFKRVKKGASSAKFTLFKRVLSLLLHGHFGEAGEFKIKIIKFKKCAKNFRIISRADKEFESVDYFILGSDTIWNQDSKYFLRCKSVFWGDIFKEQRIISYAGSLANTKAEKLVPKNEYSKSLSRWKSISVRDEYTKQVFSKLTDKDIKVVCDPTLLLELKDYKSLAKPVGGDYIFIYLFKALSKDQDRELKDFASENGLKIVVGTYRNIVSQPYDFIINNPTDFMGHMLGAKYVVTDTFHGTIFSANLQKNFVVIDRSKKKVNGFLESVHLEDRIINDKLSISEVLSRSVDYSTADSIIKRIRKDSISYLKSSLAD